MSAIAQQTLTETLALPPATALDEVLRHASPSEVIAAALKIVGRENLALVSSFGTESAALLKVMADVDPAIPVVFLDTGWLFQETLDYRDTLTRQLGLTDVRSIKPLEDAARRALELDPDLAEAHLSMAGAYLIGRWDWANAGREIDQAISLDSTNADLQKLKVILTAGGPAVPGIDKPCLIHVFAAKMVWSAVRPYKLSKAKCQLQAVGPARWADADYQKINRARFRWRFTPLGDPPGRASADLAPGKVDHVGQQAGRVAGAARAGVGRDVEDVQLVGHHFDVAGRQLRVVFAGQALADPTLDGNDILAAHFLPGVERLGLVRFDDHLGQAVAVAQVHKYLVGVRPVAVDPTVEDDCLADVRLAQLAAGVCASQQAHDLFPCYSPSRA